MNLKPALIFFGLCFSQLQGYQATGFKIGEVSSNRAIVWLRYTENATPAAIPINQSDAVTDFDVAPGSPGEIQVTWWDRANPAQVFTSDWLAVDVTKDFTWQLSLENLNAGVSYSVETRSRALGTTTVLSTKTGGFKTAPAIDSTERVLGVVSTCQEFTSAEDPVGGHLIYDELRHHLPDFFVQTGDLVYYDQTDGRPNADSVVLARQFWNKTFSAAWQQEFHQNVSAYFIKDDHDTLGDDTHPFRGPRGTLTFADGVAIQAEQTPFDSLPYGTYRWGKDLQIWLLEGRDFRSNNADPDGPNKTILGAVQKQWLMNGISNSDATFKLVLSATPIVGPDRPTKADSHANTAFQTEGEELRTFLASQENTFVICGDRHWQYASIDPTTGLREYGCGAANAAHRGALTLDESFQTYAARRGGYLSFEVERFDDCLPQITFRWHDIDNIDAQTGLATVAHEEVLRLMGDRTLTIEYDNIANTVTSSFMTEDGKFYTLEKSTTLQPESWEPLLVNATPRGNVVTFFDNQSSDIKSFYRVVESDEPLAIVSDLAPTLTASQGQTFSAGGAGDLFNRADFVLDLSFTTPTTLDSGTEFLIFEVGGTTRGTVVSVVDGRLAIGAGTTGSNVIDYLGAEFLNQGVTYNLRITAIAEAAAGEDRFQVLLHEEGAESSETIIDVMGWDVDGFSGSNGGGIGFENNGIYTQNTSSSLASPPVDAAISFELYDPDELTELFVIPSFPGFDDSILPSRDSPASAILVAAWDTFATGNTANGTSGYRGDASNPNIPADCTATDVTATLTDDGMPGGNSGIVRDIRATSSGSSAGTFGSGSLITEAATTGPAAIRTDNVGAGGPSVASAPIYLNITNGSAKDIEFTALTFHFLAQDVGSNGLTHNAYDVVFENSSSTTTTGSLGNGTVGFNVSGTGNYEAVDIPLSARPILAAGESGRFVITVSGATTTQSSAFLDNFAVSGIVPTS